MYAFCNAACYEGEIRRELAELHARVDPANEPLLWTSTACAVKDDPSPGGEGTKAISSGMSCWHTRPVSIRGRRYWSLTFY